MATRNDISSRSLTDELMASWKVFWLAKETSEGGKGAEGTEMMLCWLGTVWEGGWSSAGWLGRGGGGPGSTLGRGTTTGGAWVTAVRWRAEMVGLWMIESCGDGFAVDDMGAVPMRGFAGLVVGGDGL